MDIQSVKRDGKHRARLVALGYSQVPGLGSQKTLHQ